MDSTSTGKPAILVVEDDPETQHLDRLILRDRYEVLLAGSAEDATTRIRAGKGNIVAVLMDFSLQGSSEDGLSLTRYLRTQPGWEKTPIIATTAHASSEYRYQALLAGCDAFLPKPFRAAELLQLIEDLIARGATKE